MTADLRQAATRGAPAAKLLRRALLHDGLNPPRWELPVPAEEASALKWLADHARPVADLADAEVTRCALSAIAVMMTGDPSGRDDDRP